MGKWGISPTGLSKIIPDFPRFWKFPSTGGRAGRAGRDILQVWGGARIPNTGNNALSFKLPIHSFILQLEHNVESDLTFYFHV